MRLRENKVIVNCKTIKGSAFVGIKGYENSKGEVSNQTILVGYDYLKMLKNDLLKLKTLNIDSIIEKYGEKIATIAYSELLNSLTKLTATEEEKEYLKRVKDETITRSNAQKDAYTTLANGLKLHNDGRLFLTGLCLRKKVLVKGTYKTVVSSDKTLAKNDIKKLANLSNDKIRTFIFGSINEVNLQGVSI